MDMKNKVFKSIMVALAIVFLLPLGCLANASQEVSTFRITEEKNVLATLELNPHYQSSMPFSMNNEYEVASFEVTKIQDGKMYAILDMPVNNQSHLVNMEGNLDLVQTETQIGYMGLFCGAINCDTPVYVYAIYGSETESALIVTVGYASDDNVPEFFVFGELTKALGEISTTYLANFDAHTTYDAKETSVTKDIIPLSDYSLKYRGCTNLNKNNYNFGSLSMFSATEIGNGDSTVVYGKIVTNTDNARSYLIKELGYVDSRLDVVRAFRANMAISPNSKDCYMVSNAYKPLADSKTVTMDIPYIDASGLQFIPFLSVTYTFSSIEVDDTQKVSGAQLPNKISWDFYDSTGWPASKTDGTQSSTLSSKSGLSVYSFFHYGGNVSTKTSVTFTVTGGLSYMGEYVFENGMFPASFPVSPVSISRTITVTP